MRPMRSSTPGDMINHDIYKHVGNDFMPPFDREDIVALAGAAGRDSG